MRININKSQLTLLLSLCLIFLIIGYKFNFKWILYRVSVVEIGPNLTSDRVNFYKKFQPNPNGVVHDVLQWNKSNQVEWMNLLRPPQDDPTLVEIVRKNFLLSPSPIFPFGMKIKRNFRPISKEKLDVLISLMPQVNNTDHKFIEAGANDGFLISSSLYFERVFGWTGLLVEPNPQTFNSLWRLHRKAFIANVCLSPKPYPLQTYFFIRKQDRGLSNGIAYRNNPYQKDEGTKIIPVQCIPIFTMLLALNYTEIQLFTLDVENIEYEILKTIPFDKVKIDILFVEIEQYLNPTVGFKEINNLLEENGYKFITKFGPDHIFHLKSK